jgi:VIT1/CCC1 family predicted Fe2+/Mn2+ transporter
MPQDFAAALARHKHDEHKIGRVQEFLKQIVYGGNDGIVTTFAVVAGFAGYGAQNDTAAIGGIAVLLFGLANLFADATAMGLGEYLSSRSERDVYQATRARELREIRRNPDFEQAEAVEILTARGMQPGDARIIAEAMSRNPEYMADFMMQHEIGMADPTDDAPAARGLMTFLAFVSFGSAPLIPYVLFDPVPRTFGISVFATFCALAALGLLRWKVTSQTLVRCVGEAVLVGGICAAVAFLVGLAIAQ